MSKYFPIVAVLAVCLGCTEAQSPTPATQPKVAEVANSPEGVYRRFMIANLSGDENAIRPLILDHDNADVLWQGAYPDKVAAAFVELYRDMEITRVDSPKGDEARVLLKSSASPIPFPVVNVEGTWKIDASAMIEIRKAAASLE